MSSPVSVYAQCAQPHTLVHIKHTHSLPLNELKVVGMVWGVGAWVRIISVSFPSSKCVVQGPVHSYDSVTIVLCVRPSVIHVLQ